jgi:flagellar hook protein FlgE
MNLEIGRDGIITGKYSNGESDDLFRISLFRFNSDFGLKREGNNHFSATKESNAAQEGKPDTENYGFIASNALEQSNVDMAREFVTMITTQRGFQSNSKIITTQDQLIQNAIQMKR